MAQIEGVFLHVKGTDGTVYECKVYDSLEDVGDGWEVRHNGSPAYIALADDNTGEVYKAFGTPLAIRRDGAERWVLTEPAPASVTFTLTAADDADGQYMTEENGETLTLAAGQTVVGRSEYLQLLNYNFKYIHYAGDFQINPCDGSNENTCLEEYALECSDDFEINAYRMFFHCRKLTRVDIQGGRFTDMTYMLQGCYAITSLEGLAGLDVSNVASMNRMLQSCTALTSLEGLAGWDVGAVTDMSSAFYGCTSLTDISALSGWDVSKATNLQNLFYNCTSLASLEGLTGWDTGSATDMSYMFYGCSALTDMSAIAGWDVGGVTSMSHTFYYCTALTDISALAGWDVSKVTNMSCMFQGCTSIVDASPIADWDVGNVTNLQSLFYGCDKLTTVRFNDWDVSKAQYIDSAFNCASLTTVEGSITGISVKLSLSDSPLTRESALVFINGLNAGSPATLTLSDATKALLTDADIAIATDKGWTIA